MKILIVEDNRKIANNIIKFLALENITCEVAYDGQVGLNKAIYNNYDAILLDIMLPTVDGISFCKKIRETKETPIIMVTAKSSLDDKMEGFDCGADDYITKPFDLPELLARLKAVNKRLANYEKFKYRDITICLEKKKAYKEGKEINMTIKEFNIIEYLLQNHGVPISRTDLIEYIWGGDGLFEGDNKLDVYISNIRKKLDKNLIITVKGFGYKIDKM